MRTLWGIDLGGTKIEGVVLPASFPPDIPPQPLARIRIATQQEGGYEHILGRIEELVTRLETASNLNRPEQIGLGMPGTIDCTGLVKNANTTCLIGKPLDRELGRLLGIQVVAMNDANLFALAESRFGAASCAATVFGVIIGTGVGGGIVVDGTVLGGAHGIAGEWGHNVLIPGGNLCYCGKRGCVETVISGPALESHYRALAGEPLPMSQIATEADEYAVATIDRLCDYFGRALAVVVNILDPEVIVLGGGLGNIDALYTRGRDSLARHVFNGSFEGKLVRPALGDSAGVFGAALLTL